MLHTTLKNLIEHDNKPKCSFILKIDFINAFHLIYREVLLI